MLNRTRNEVLNILTMKLQNDLDLIGTECGDFTDMNDGTYYTQEYINGYYQHLPAEQVGWPPGVREYIRRVAMATAVSIVDAIYTEKEMEAKVDDILLDNDTQ